MMPVIVVFGMFMVGLGLLLYITLDRRLNAFVEKQVAEQAYCAAQIYSQELQTETRKLEEIADVITRSQSSSSDEEANTYAHYLDGFFGNASGVLVGVLRADGTAIYGEALSPP